MNITDTITSIHGNYLHEYLLAPVQRRYKNLLS